MHPSCTSSSPTSERLKRSDGHRNSSITPQRKHRKLLKDGSGSEVWPENVEEIFVQGLRRYWESPWATFSRGRSRWRNQFLVEHLHKAGIERSKKQVASHMQVLRNMWKGEPEYHLVAGGEEMLSETGPLATVKAEDPCESLPLTTLGGDDRNSIPHLSPSPSTPGYSSEFKLESPSHSPSQSGNIFDTFTANPFPIDSPHAHSPSSSHHDTGNVLTAQSPVTRGSPPSTFPFEHGSMLQSSSNSASPLYSMDYQTHTFTPLALTASPESTNAVLPQLAKLEIPASPIRFLDQAPSTIRPAVLPSSTTLNKLSNLCLWAEGMSPLKFNVEYPNSVILQIKLSLPNNDDSLPALHGFHGTVTFSAQWPSTAKCVTKVYTGKACISEETESLHLVTSTRDCRFLTGFLPSESSLSRCRWFEPNLQFSISQEFILNGEPVALVLYDLERKSSSSAPAALLTSISGSDVTSDSSAVTRTPTTPLHYHYPTSYNLSTPQQPHSSRFWRYDQPLSCGLTPINGMTPSMSTPMLF